MLCLSTRLCCPLQRPIHTATRASDQIVCFTVGLIVTMTALFPDGATATPNLGAGRNYLQDSEEPTRRFCR